MELRSLATAEPFTTKDGSTIRELHHTPVQSLAEATLEAGQSTQRHYHAVTEEIYLITRGKSMQERSARQVAVAKQQQDEYIRQVAGTSPAEQIEKAKAMLDRGAITPSEFDVLKGKALA